MHNIIEMFDNNVNVDEMNGSILAYVGDCVFEIYVRTKLVLEKQRKLKELNDEESEDEYDISAWLEALLEGKEIK